MKVTLDILEGPRRGQSFEFRDPRGFVIGRRKDADLSLPDDPYVGRLQALLEICPPICRIRDLAARNPTLVNGAEVTESELFQGDLIEVGFTRLRVAIDAALPSRSQPCGFCGRPITLLDGEPVQESCAACAAANAARAPSKPTTTIQCHDAACGVDLTARANSDGRAGELAGIAMYSCEEHLPQGDESAGTTIGGYQVIRSLGVGGFGKVSLVYDRQTARLFALKVLKDLRESALVKRFERELRLHKRLAHDNIVRCVETGVDETGAPYLVTEYVDGGSLADREIESDLGIRIKEAAKVVDEVLVGIEYLHGREIIHRDIKPDNILLERGTGRPKLADFGLALSYARAGGTRITKPDVGMGTLMFMPAEQIRDAHSVREPADTYSTGVTLYYMLTGRYCFDFPTPDDVREFRRKNRRGWRSGDDALRALMQLRRIQHPYNIILSEDPTPIRQRDPGIPTRLAEVVDKSVRKDPTARFRSAAEFRHALRHAVQ